MDETAALAGIFGVTVDDLVRPELHPLTARIQLTSAALAEPLESWRSASARGTALEDFAEATFADRSRDRWVTAMTRVIERTRPQRLA